MVFSFDVYSTFVHPHADADALADVAEEGADTSAQAAVDIELERSLLQGGAKPTFRRCGEDEEIRFAFGMDAAASADARPEPNVQCSVYLPRKGPEGCAIDDSGLHALLRLDLELRAASHV